MFDTKGNMTINSTAYRWDSAKDAAVAATNEAFQSAFDESINQLVAETRLRDSLNDRFTANIRRLRGHINSNMGLKICLRESDA